MYFNDLKVNDWFVYNQMPHMKTGEGCAVYYYNNKLLSTSMSNPDVQKTMDYVIVVKKLLSLEKLADQINQLLDDNYATLKKDCFGTFCIYRNNNKIDLIETNEE